VSISFSELRAKEVIRLCDAEVIGCVIDLLFDERSGNICALCAAPTSGFCALFSGERTVIPWERVRCIGRDTVLVDMRAEDCGCAPDDTARGKWKRFSRKF